METPSVSLQQIMESLQWPAELARELAASAHTISYEKGAHIFNAGEPADLLYVLLAGEVKLYYSTAGGARLLVRIARSGDLLGSSELDLAAVKDYEQPEQIFHAKALSRCKVGIITRQRVAAAARRLEPEAVLNLVGRSKANIERFSTRVLAFLLMDVRSRLAYTIRQVADLFGIDDPRGKLIPLRLSHEDFGEMVGASRPMVSKHLKHFASAGFFYKQNGRYILAEQAAGKVCGLSGSAPADQQHVAKQQLRRPPRNILQLARPIPGRSLSETLKASGAV